MPDELRADSAYYARSAEGVGSQVRESEAALRFQERQTTDQHPAGGSDARLHPGAAGRRGRQPRERAARVRADARPLRARRRAHAGARSGADRVRCGAGAGRRAQEAGGCAALRRRAGAIERRAGRRSAAARCRRCSCQQAAANAQRTKADVRLAYTEIHAPIDGIVDVRAVRVGEVVTPGPAGRDAHQPGRPLGARRRRGDLHRRRAAGRQADGPAAVGRRARGDGVLPRRRCRRSPRSATSAAPSATSRPSRSACASTTATAGSRSA